MGSIPGRIGKDPKTSLGPLGQLYGLLFTETPRGRNTLGRESGWAWVDLKAELIGEPTACSVFSSRGTDEHPGLRRRGIGGPGGGRSRKRPQPGAPIDMVTDGDRGTGRGPGPGPSEIPSTLEFMEFC